RRVAPRLALISAGEDNPYGHPAPSTVAALRAGGATVLSTDRDGDLAVVGEGEGLMAVRSGGVHGEAAVDPADRCPRAVGPRETEGMDATRIDAYLSRLGAERPDRPTSQALRELHLRHLRTVPFENLSLHLGEEIV